MIGLLRGRVVALSPEQVLLDIGGVGYAVSIPVPTYYRLERAGVGSEATLYVHTHVREDALALFGFSSPEEKRLFERLIAISGIGPKLARVVLSGMDPETLVAALARGDVARLATIPGVGKKTAERMVLELKDKIADLALPGPAPTPAAATADDELLAALENLGYRRREAERAVAAVAREHPDAELPERLRRTLKRLARL